MNPLHGVAKYEGLDFFSNHFLAAELDPGAVAALCNRVKVIVYLD